jgi:formylglycine-generating enzyme required for sulfatase activity/tRNA A-37 threonylcarbamoyl transferase component Bud32
MQDDTLRLVGTTVQDKYVVEQVVGEGGFSVVYRATHLIWKQPVALKCFKVQALASQDLRQELLDAFIQEGRLMTELSTRTSAIVQARDVGTITRDDGTWIPFLVLEWLEGKPLDKVLEEEVARHEAGRTVEQCVDLLNGAAEAVALAHRRNIVHRDIKPANLFVTAAADGAGESVKILDFGVAKVMAEHLDLDKALKQTSATLTAFTPSYGAPEQFSRAHGATGPWTDVYAFALVMVELLRGGVPALEGDDYLQLAMASANEAVRPTPRRYGLNVSDQVEAVFAKALAVKPADRFATMGEFWRALRSAVFPQERGWTPPESRADVAVSLAPRSASSAVLALAATTLAAPPGTPSAMVPPDVTTTSPTHAPPASTGAPSRGRAAMVLGAAALIMLGTGGLVMLRKGTRSESPAVAAAPTASSASSSSSASTPPVCPPDMAAVPGGKFFMGSDDDSFSAWKPAHKVELSPYCIDIDEVTAGQYKACSDVGECKRAATRSSWKKAEGDTQKEHERKEEAYSTLCTFGREGMERHPINCVTWADAANYCKVHGKRLPTEAEWEFAARKSDGRKFPWGDDPPTSEHMNACGLECTRWMEKQGLKPGPRMYETDDGYPGTAPVGSYPKGRTIFGLNDMVGNVFEWTSDWMGPYTADEQKDPQGPAEGVKKVIRGGGFNGGYVSWVNPAFRYGMEPERHTHAIGFRCAKSLP